MSVLSRPRTARRTAVPSPRTAPPDEALAQTSAPERPAPPAPPAPKRTRALVFVVALLIAAAAAIGTAVYSLSDGDTPTTLAPGVLNGSQETERLRDESAVQRQQSGDAARGAEAERHFVG